MSQSNLARVESTNQLSVHKFGGSSLATAKCIRRVISILKQHCSFVDAVVVSANGKTTDALIEIVDLLGSDKSSAIVAIETLVIEHTNLISELVSEPVKTQLVTELKKDALEITSAADSGITESASSDILAKGEIWSARLLAAALSEHFAPAQYIDARDFLVIDNSVDANVDEAKSTKQLTHYLDNTKISVVTGYIAKDSNGETATLGRNGSDYSATIVADLISAGQVTLWTDVDGIYSADPRLVPSARKLHRLPNCVAKELGSLGNPVLHVNTLKPLDSESIHLHVRSSFDVDSTATEIGDFGQIAQQELCITSLNDLVLTKFETPCNAIFTEHVQKLRPIHFDKETNEVIAVREQLEVIVSLANQHNIKFSSKDVSLIAAVGFDVAHRGNIKAQFLRSVRQAKPINVLRSDTGHSLIAIFEEEIPVELLNRAHSKLTQDAKNIGLVVAGLGNIGSRFIELLPAQLQRIPALDNVHLVGLVGSTRAYFNNDGIDPSEAITQFNHRAVDYHEEELIERLAHHPYDELVIVDITPSESFSNLYREFFQHGIHVIGANKWAASSSQDNFDFLNETAKKHQSQWLGNTTVGAGLPINFAINDLINSGDQISEISGIFSGTLSWLFEKFDGSVPFSVLVKDALAQGLTEPDPRDDLSGRDVQRKLLILARAAGFKLSLDDIECKNLVPESLQSIEKHEFLSRIDELDGDFSSLIDEANAKNECLRYIASFNAGDFGFTAKVELVSLPKDHAFSNLTPCDNVFKVNSLWYQENALIIRGPGAGRDVTAGGIHSDLVTLCQRLTLQTKQAKIRGIN